jgi:DNA-binding NtrC family response regulator
MSTRRILIVEDDVSHRETLHRHLGRSGYDVMAVDCGEGALSNLSSFAPDLVITDVRMPGLSGFDVLQRVRRDCPDVDVVMITAYEVMQGAIDAMKEGAYDYLIKPLDLDQVDAVVEQCFKDRASRVLGHATDVAISDAPADALVGRDAKMLEVYKLIGTVARTRAPVLVRGETGTGKELIAHTIHANSPNASEPFVAINCTAVPESLLESELFGHVKGSFTGASADRRGRFEQAASGTVFLDEIGDTSLSFQSKLLRVLQEREFHPVGSEEPRRTNARVVAATHRNLEEMVERSEFREDLYFRLRVIEIDVPPLRERRGDIPLLAEHILSKVSGEVGEAVPAVPDDVMAALLSYDWPGNVREMENALTRAMVMAKGTALSLEHLSLGPRAESVGATIDEDSLDAVERIHVQRILSKAGGNKSRAAKILGVSRPRLDRMISKHGLVL